MLLEQGIIRIILYQFLLVVRCSLQDLTGILMVLTSTYVVDSVFFLLTIFGFRKMMVEDGLDAQYSNITSLWEMEII